MIQQSTILTQVICPSGLLTLARLKQCWIIWGLLLGTLIEPRILLLRRGLVRGKISGCMLGDHIFLGTGRPAGITETTLQQDWQSDPDAWQKPSEQPRSASPDASGMHYENIVSAI